MEHATGVARRCETATRNVRGPHRGTKHQSWAGRSCLINSIHQSTMPVTASAPPTVARCGNWGRPFRPGGARTTPGGARNDGPGRLPRTPGSGTNDTAPSLVGEFRAIQYKASTGRTRPSQGTRQDSRRQRFEHCFHGSSERTPPGDNKSRWISGWMRENKPLPFPGVSRTRLRWRNHAGTIARQSMRPWVERDRNNFTEAMCLLHACSTM